MKKLLIVGVLALFFGVFTVYAQDDLPQVIENCNATASVRLPEGWQGEHYNAGRSSVFILYREDNGGSPDDREGGLIYYGERTMMDRERWNFDPMTVSPQEIALTYVHQQIEMLERSRANTELYATAVIATLAAATPVPPPTEVSENLHNLILSGEQAPSLFDTPQVGEFVSLDMISPGIEGGFVPVIRGDGDQSLIAGFATPTHFGLATVTVSDEDESLITAIFESFSIAPPDEETYTYFTNDCRFQIQFPSLWIRSAGLDGLYLYNTSAAYDVIGYQNAQPESGMVEVRVHDWAALDELIYNVEAKAISPEALMDEYLGEHANYELGHEVPEGYVETTIRDYPALRADVLMNTHGRLGEGLALVITLPEDEYAVIFAKFASDELSRFEAQILELASTLRVE